MNGGGRQAKSIAASNPARPSLPPIPAFRKDRTSARVGCRDTPPTRSRPAPIPTRPTTPAPAIEANLSLLSPEQDAQILREAGFADVELFYAAFTWRGWIAYA